MLTRTKSNIPTIASQICVARFYKSLNFGAHRSAPSEP